MLSKEFAIVLCVLLCHLGQVSAHIAAWAKGIYCLNGNQTEVNENSDNIVQPLFNLSQKDWWFHHVDNCDQYPPAEGDILELPAGGQFTVEMATNRGKTSLSFGGQYTSEWPDGADYPEDYNMSPGCITSPNMHTQNQSMAAGSAFAISYTSNIAEVTPENLVVFSVRLNTPFKRLVNFDVPADLPPCPKGGCTCGWGWIPNACGEPNIYHVPYKCNVTGSTSTKVVGPGKPATWCEGNPDACVKGPKQMLYWNQAEGNNIEVEGYDLSGMAKSPAYNAKCGFSDGAQNDIFIDSTASSSGSSSSSSSVSAHSTSSSTSTAGSSGSTSSPDHGSSGSSSDSATTTAVPPVGSTPSKGACSAHSKRSATRRSPILPPRGIETASVQSKRHHLNKRLFNRHGTRGLW